MVYFTFRAAWDAPHKHGGYMARDTTARPQRGGGTGDRVAAVYLGLESGPWQVYYTTIKCT